MESKDILYWMDSEDKDRECRTNMTEADYVFLRLMCMEKEFEIQAKEM